MDLFEQLLEASADNIIVVDHDGRYTHVSAGAAAAIGFSRVHVVGKHWRELGLSEDVMVRVEEQWSEVFVTGVAATHQISARGRVYQYSMFPLANYVAVIARDVTELHAATVRYRQFMASSFEGIWLFALDAPIETTLPIEQQIQLAFDRGYLAECNDTMARMYGFERATEITGARLPDMLDPTQEHNRAFLRAFIQGGYRLSEAESIENDRNGNRKYFMNSFAGQVEDGKLLGAWGTQRDVTTERLTSERIRISEERLQALVDASTQIVWTAGPHGLLTWITASWTDVTGQKTEDALESGWTSSIHPDDALTIASAWRAAEKKRTRFDMKLRIRTRDGAYRWALVRGVPLFNTDGSIREWVGGIADIDPQHRETEALAAQQRRAEFIADANDLFVRSLNSEETLRNLARMAVPRLGDWCAVDMIEPDGTFRRLAVEHRDPAMVKVAYELQAKYPDDPSSKYGSHEVRRSGKTISMPEIPDELLVAGTTSAEHLDLIRKLKLRSYISAPIWVRDRVAGVLTLVSSTRSYADRDIELAEELALRAGHAIENARLYEQAVAANRTKDEFLATLSHELRTPLTAILGWANLLRMSNYDADTLRKAVTTIEQSARAQASLIDDLLDISRIVTGKLQLHIAPVDIVPVIETGIAAVRPAAAAKRIAIDVTAPKSLTIHGDSNRLQQIVWNLMSNSVKFSGPDTSISVSVWGEDGQAVIRVTDQGIGIDPGVLPHVFDRFWQADSSSHRIHGGLGLGLAIVRYLTELHGGTVTGESQGKDRGATFTVRLPIGTAEQEAAPMPFDKHATGTNVLVVDDDPSAREIIRRTLEHFGAQVTTASSAAEALAIAQQRPMTIVFTDIAMPENDGYWLLRTLRKTLPHLKVVAITALGTSDAQLRSSGFDAFARKPVEPAELVAILDRLSV